MALPDHIETDELKRVYYVRNMVEIPFQVDDVKVVGHNGVTVEDLKAIIADKEGKKGK